MPIIKPPEILPVMVGTAGHVDHGKTSLVHLLTGCNTDALKEEKKRGLTIDLGFAPCLVAGNRMVGIVDVPGHIDFIKNMVAGSASLDILMLIVAADDSVMPQTLEHLQIVKLLRTPLVMVVITKIDLVEPDMVEMVKEDVADFLGKAGYPDSPIIPMSNITLDGISSVRNTLSELVTLAREKRENDPIRHQAFRMNIERVFSVKGFGTVATGIPISGVLHNGDNVELLPAHEEGKIRSVQNYKHKSDKVLPNACNAINISGIEADHVTRGMTLAMPNVYQAVTRVTVQLLNVGRIPITDGMSVRFHAGTSGVHAEIALLSSEPIRPGCSGFIQCRLSEPVVLLAGDHFILRRYSPSETLAGGKVISIQNVKYKRNEPHLIERFEHATEAVQNNQLALAEIYAGGHAIFNGMEMMKYAGLVDQNAKESLQKLVEQNIIIQLDPTTYVTQNRLAEISTRVQRVVSHFHNQKIYSWGAEPGLIASALTITPQAGKPLCECLAKTYPEIYKMRHARLSLSSFSPKISAKQMKQKEELLNYLQQCAEKIPAQGTLLDELQLTSPELKFLIKVLIESNEVMQVGKHVFEYELYQKLYHDTLQCFKDHPEGVTLNHLRDVTHLSRNMLVAFIEHIDGKGLTRRHGDLRFLTGAQNK